jgi:PAS domain S-box-containing protein
MSADPPPPEPERATPASSGEAHEAWLEAVLESVSDAFYALDTSWRFVVFNRAAEAYFGRPRDQVLGRAFLELFPQGRGADFERRLIAAMNRGVGDTYETGSAMRPDRVVELRITPVRDGGVAVSLRDVTERRQAEHRQRLLVNELNHRVKNALATVQAIASQSLRIPDIPSAAVDRFMARLMALASANDILLAKDWQGAELEAIARQVASPYVARGDEVRDGGDARFLVDGPTAVLGPRAATAMALALHELATNAAKYGALSTPQGRVSLTWGFQGEGDARRLQLAWRENDGPAVRPPVKLGFGSRLIEKGLKAELRAKVLVEYAPSGLRMSLDAPMPVAPSD